METVLLPWGPIAWDDLAVLIAEHDVPAPRELAGIGCIRGKHFFIDLEQPPTRADWRQAGYPYDSEPRGVYSIEEELSQEERTSLAVLLLKNGFDLSGLHIGISPAETSAFLAAYRSMPGRPPWEPTFQSPADLQSVRQQRLELRANIGLQLQEEITKGTIRLQDRQRTQYMHLAPGLQLLRPDAIRFLEMLDIRHSSPPPPSEEFLAAKTREPAIFPFVTAIAEDLKTVPLSHIDVAPTQGSSAGSEQDREAAQSAPIAVADGSPSSPPPSLLAIRQMIRSRFDELGVPMPYEELLDRVNRKAVTIVNSSPTPDADLSLLVLLNRYPSAFDSFVPSLPKKKNRKKPAKHVKELMAPLERALLHCVTAQLPLLNPVRGAHDHAMTLVNAHDSLLEKQAEAEVVKREKRVLGGQKRHGPHHSLLAQVPVLLETLAPPKTGWKNLTHAAKDVGASLCEQGRKKGFAVSPLPTTWQANVSKYMKENPEAQTAFERNHCKSKPAP